MKEFKITTDVNGVESVKEILPTTSCCFCDCKIKLSIAGLYYGACKKCYEKNPQLWFEECLITISLNDIPTNQSPFGNNFYTITKSQIEGLLNGEVLYSLGEYGTFIKLVEE